MALAIAPTPSSPMCALEPSRSSSSALSRSVDASAAAPAPLTQRPQRNSARRRGDARSSAAQARATASPSSWLFEKRNSASCCRPPLCATEPTSCIDAALSPHSDISSEHRRSIPLPVPRRSEDNPTSPAPGLRANFRVVTCANAPVPKSIPRLSIPAAVIPLYSKSTTSRLHGSCPSPAASSFKRSSPDALSPIQTCRRRHPGVRRNCASA
mmetsp:Transcript_43726/g.91228  ORF Transcript_43726/g.91228 Transcript_43726/m.91228 type:complete len:212 (+) Transcript_43726:880-1515(+)